jgi:uncharacterized cupredoxin-like copper-binding protein
MGRRYLSVVGIVLVAMLALSACGTQDDDPEPTVTRIPDAANAPQLTPDAGESTPITEAEDGTPAPASDASPADAASPAAEPAAAATDGSESTEVTIVSHDIYFEPAEVTIPADTDVTFLLPNEGAAPHNFSIDELSIDIDQAPGETDIEVMINAPAGQYEFYCNVPGHREAGMVGTLTVE